MTPKIMAGVAAWPMHWTLSAKDETSGLLRLMCVMNGPLAVTACPRSPAAGRCPSGSCGSWP